MVARASDSIGFGSGSGFARELVANGFKGPRRGGSYHLGGAVGIEVPFCVAFA